MFKKMIISFIALGLAANAYAQSERREEFQASLSLFSLRCALHVGQLTDQPLEQRLSVILGGDLASTPLVILAGDEIKMEFEHKSARANSCPLEFLDQLVQRSTQNFGFIFDVPMVVTTTLSKPFINGFGQCIQRVSETLEINLSDELKLKSVQGELRASSDCP